MVDDKNKSITLYDPTERRIRSFVVRAGRLSPAQKRAIDELGPEYCLPFQKELLNFRKAFKREAETILEIGFGMGETTAEIAENMPEYNFLAIDVHAPGIGSLLKHIDERSLKNIRIIQYDAVDIITHMIPKQSLHGIHIFFPDPWHKTRHHKRRLIQPKFVELITCCLKPGGYIHCATDWEAYAEQMLEVLEGEPFLKNTTQGYAPRPVYRPETKFEKRGKRLGHLVWDLIFKTPN